MTKIGIFLVSIFLVIGAQVSLRASEEKAVTVLVAPFHVQCQEPLDYVSQAVPHLLSSRLEAEEGIKTIDESVVAEALKKLKITTVDEANARSLGMETGADWVILGTIIKQVDSITLDARLVGISADKPTLSESYQENSLKRLIDGVGVLAKQLGNKILGKVIVVDIGVKGNRLIEDAAILDQVKTKVGDVYSPETLQEDIRTIYKMGFFNDIKIDSTDEPAGKKIIFVVNENPEIAQIKIAGNKEINVSDIEKQIDIKPHTILDYNKAKANALKIKKFYEGKGYHNALVEYKTEEVSPEQAALVFQIVEHHTMKIKKIKITGNKKLKDSAIKSVMESREKNLLSFLTQAGTFKEEALKVDRDRIVAYYYDFGYLDVKVGEPEVTHDEKWFYITIPVEEGDQYRVNDVKIGGDLIETKPPLQKQIKVTKGEVFSRQKIQTDIGTITDAYGEFGYAFVDITPLTKINADNKTVDLTYDISKGKEVYFEKIKITGNTRTRDKVIRREMRIKEEDLYNNKKLKKSRERINNLGYFEDVKINTQKGSEPNKMDVEVNVKEKPTGMISAGAGYSSAENMVGMFQISQRNFLGKGLAAVLMAQVGSYPAYRLALTEPYLFDKQISAGFDVFRMDQYYEDFDSRNQGLSLTFGFLPIKNNEDVSLSFQFGYSTTDISDIDTYAKYDNEGNITKIIYDVDRDIYEAKKDSPITVSTITATLARETIDDQFYPMRGSSNSLSLSVAGLTGEKFAKGIIDSRWYFPFKWATAFSVHGSAGWAKGYGGDEVPVFQRFFLGGLDSLRGFEDREVGPRGKDTDDPIKYKWIDLDDDGVIDPNESFPVYLSGDAITGGDKMAFCQFEYLFPLIKAAKIRGLVFFDAGSSWGGPGDKTGFDLRTDVGCGIRWNSPFGPLRVDWGLNLSPKHDEKGSNFGFSAGAGF
ncbi:MAG TPA: outer membrane protein assembly factor BamA [Thermodesulfobacteriota bacterium]|nr:outer membrane protein assembly factor BamA [Thermodesulfobacteriota bacterium]